MAKISSNKSIIAQRYAKSLFTLAQKADSVELIRKALGDFSRLLQESKELQNFIASPLLKGALKAEIMEEFLKNAGEVPELFRNFFRVVSANGRLALLPDIIAAYEHCVLESLGESFAEIISAKALTKAQEEEIQSLLRQVSGKVVHLKKKVDPALLSGFIVRFGSYQIDTSLLKKLFSLKLALKEVS